MQSSCRVGDRHRNNNLGAGPLAGTRIDCQAPSQQRETLANAEQPETASVRPWQVQLFRNKTFTLVFHVDNNHIFSLRYVHMSFLDARMLDDIDQKLPHRLKSHDCRIAA